MKTYSVVRMLLLGVCVGVMRTPRENALMVTQLHQRPALTNVPATWTSVFRGAPLTVFCDVCFFLVLHQTLVWLQEGFGTFGSDEAATVSILNIGWYGW
jgi:hypothetical protein